MVARSQTRWPDAQGRLLRDLPLGERPSRSGAARQRERARDVTVTVVIELNGARVPLQLDDDALRAIAAAVAPAAPPYSSPFLTIVETAEYLRCPRQRIDDLLSQRKLTRHKDGARTLVSRTELEEYIGR